MGSTGEGRLADVRLMLLDSCSQEGPARSSELFHSELLVFAEYRGPGLTGLTGLPSTFSSSLLSRPLFLSRAPGVYLKACLLQRESQRERVCIGRQEESDNPNRLLLPLDRLTQHEVPLL